MFHFSSLSPAVGNQRTNWMILLKRAMKSWRNSSPRSIRLVCISVCLRGEPNDNRKSTGNWGPLVWGCRHCTSAWGLEARGGVHACVWVRAALRCVPHSTCTEPVCTKVANEIMVLMGLTFNWWLHCQLLGEAFFFYLDAWHGTVDVCVWWRNDMIWNVF